MILLSTTDKLRVVTDAAATLVFTGDYADVSGTTVTVSPAAPQSIVTATTTDIVAAPGAGVRNVKHQNFRNAHATLAVTATVLFNRSGTDYEIRKETLQPGDHLTFDEGVGWYRSAASAAATLTRTLSADATAQNVATVQPWFPSTGSVTVVANTTYYFFALLELIRSAGTTSHTTSLQWGGTATLTSIDYRVDCNVGDVETTSTDGPTFGHAATALAIKAASVSATEALHCLVTGTIRINAAGTLIPQFIFSAAPGGAPLVKRGTFIQLQPWGSGAFTAQGPWA